jgi:hypothetical protein
MVRKRARKPDLEREGRGLVWPIARGHYPGPRCQTRFCGRMFRWLGSHGKPGDLCYSRTASGILLTRSNLCIKVLETPRGRKSKMFRCRCYVCYSQRFTIILSH